MRTTLPRMTEAGRAREPRVHQKSTGIPARGHRRNNLAWIHISSSRSSEKILKPRVIGLYPLLESGFRVLDRLLWHRSRQFGRATLPRSHYVDACTYLQHRLKQELRPPKDETWSTIVHGDLVIYILPGKRFENVFRLKGIIMNTGGIRIFSLKRLWLFALPLFMARGVLVALFLSAQQGKAIPDPEDFFAGIRNGGLSLEPNGDGWYTIQDSTKGGGDFPWQVELVKIEREHVIVRPRPLIQPEKLLTIPH